MNPTEPKDTILQALAAIAPEALSGGLDPAMDFRDQFDFDSMDFLNFAIDLSKRLRFNIPERDFSRLSSLAGCLAYLREKQPLLE